MQDFADVFGVKFPVCNADQKARLEAAFDEASAYEKDNPPPQECTCELLIDLLTPGTTRNSAIVAAWIVARDIFQKKAALEALALRLEMVEFLTEEVRGNA